MSQPGWYPDPGGREGHYRYWDGSHWSASTSTSPSGPPPSTANRPRATGGPGSQPRSATAAAEHAETGSGRSILLMSLVGVLVLALIAAGVWALFIRDGGGDEPLSPRPARSAWDEVVTPTPTPTPTRVTRSPSSSKLCPYTIPSNRKPPTDDRWHGGGISFARPAAPDWDYQIVQLVPWVGDIAGAGKSITPLWFSMLIVGQLEATEFGTDPARAAEQVMSCTASSGMYSGITGRVDTREEPMQISGHNGFRIESEITVADQGPDIPGDRMVVITVDTGSDDLAVFMGSATLGDEHTNAELDQAIASLSVD